MNWWQRFRRKRELERQLETELRFHLEQQVSDFVRAGMSPDEARRSAALKFGTVEEVKESCRDARGTRWVENALQDIRYTLRILRGSPSFTIVAVLCLALGIGANTAIYSVIDALMIRALPVEQPQQLVLLGEGQSAGSNDDFAHDEPDLFSWPFYQELRKNNPVFSDLLAIRSSGLAPHVRLGGPGAELERVQVRLVSGNYFSVLGVPASLGRVLMPEDDHSHGGSPVAVMRYGFWEQRFARDRGVIGRTISINGSAVTIVGVAVPGFFGTAVGSLPDFWIPLGVGEQSPSGDAFDNLTQSLWLIGRLKPGISLAEAQASTNVRYRQWLHSIAGSALSAEQIQKIKRAHVTLTEAARGTSRLRREFSRPLQIVMGLVGLVLLIACVNIANLLLARAAGRQREIALRMALGASQRRLLAQLLCESLLLSLFGGVLGLLFSLGGVRLLLGIVSNGGEPVPLVVGLHSGVLLFTIALSLLTGLVFGTVPALYMTALDVGPALKEGKGLARSHSHSRWGHALVVVQVALAFLLILGAAVFVDTFKNLEQANLGFEKNRVLLLQIDSDPIRSSGPAALLSLYRRLEVGIQQLPGVQAASFSEVTFNEGHWRTLVWPKGAVRSEETGKSFNGDHVGAQYFQVLGTPFVMGRGFGPQDTPKSRPVAVVNETFARSLFPNISSLGRHFSLEGSDEFEIIGVVRDARYESVREKPRGAFFVYNEQQPTPDGYSDLVVRSRQRPELLISQIRQMIRGENPDLVISTVRTLSEQVDQSLGTEKLLADLAGFFGVVALLLACIGLYGVVAYSVARRRNEIGIRMALGAKPTDVLGALLGESLTVVAVGLLIGLPVALAAGRLVANQLYGVKASDPLLIGTAAALLLGTALAASFIPGRRAAFLDPLIALREE